MTALRVLKAVTVCAFAVLLLMAWVFRFNANGYSQTLTSLRASWGDGAYIFIAIFSVVSLISTPLIGIAGLVGLAASKKLGRDALLCGLVCCAICFAQLLLWKNYGGMPTHDSGIQAVRSTAKPAAAPNQQKLKPATTP
jgi:hypothetical protein